MEENESLDDVYIWIAEREATPTYKRTHPYTSKALRTQFDAYLDGSEPSIDAYWVPTAAAIRGISALACDVEESEDDPLSLEPYARLAFDSLQEIAKLHPEAAKLARVAAQTMMLSWVAAGRSLASAQIEREVPVIRSLSRVNAAKAVAVERAQAIANELWQADIEQEIRLGEMADRVYRALASEGFTEALPGTTERIKEWIKPAAPDYARKGGRRRKTP